jgi:DNA-binding IclR family transcriptional regulator
MGFQRPTASQGGTVVAEQTASQGGTVAAEKTASKVLDNAITVLLAFPPEGSISVTELSDRVGLTKGAISKILATYRRHGFVLQSQETRRFYLGPTLIHLGYQSLNRLDIRSVAKPFLQELSRKYSENTMLMIAEGDNAMIIEQCESPLTVKVTMRLGEFYPLYRGAAPKLLLAHLPAERIDAIIEAARLEALTPFSITDKLELRTRLEQIRQDGYSVSAGEIDSSAKAIAVPVRDIYRNVVASIAIAGPKSRMETASVDDMLADLFQVSKEISGRLGVG